MMYSIPQFPPSPPYKFLVYHCHISVYGTDTSLRWLFSPFDTDTTYLQWLFSPFDTDTYPR